jgi:hypothetical protein
MSVTDIEPVVIEGIDLEGTPPCGLLTGPRRYCGRPSAYRALFGPCPKEGCSPGGRLFLCSPCLNIILTFGGFCGNCWAGNPRSYHGLC